MRTICLYFEIHQIIHLKRYRFFDIGTNHYYYDDYANEFSINEVAERSYIPALSALIEMLRTPVARSKWLYPFPVWLWNNWRFMRRLSLICCTS